MYIEYRTTQFYKVAGEEGFKKSNVMPNIVPNCLLRPDFMPTKLVRIFDMKVVYGSQVNEGYCALSYSWNQSGDILLDEATGKYNRIDEGKHKIIDHHAIDDLATRRLNNIKFYNNDYFTKATKYVKFEGIIQQICQQFNIKYIWYDQMCINQENKKEKQHEIRNMHHIYENAYCTVVLVPEFNVDVEYLIMNAQYFKQLWTLHETVNSKKLLVVGSSYHSWGDEIEQSNTETSANEILWHAHQRTATRHHDRVFALINIFPDLIQHIDINYYQPFEELMLSFYGLLAKKDISILFFKKTSDYYRSTIQDYEFLPSWVGIFGEHFQGNSVTISSFQNYSIIGKTMFVTCNSFTNDKSNEDVSSQNKKLPDYPFDEDFYDEGKKNYCLCVSIQITGTNVTQKIRISPFLNHNDIAAENYSFFTFFKTLQKLSYFMEINEENLSCYYANIDDYNHEGDYINFDFDILLEDLDDPFAQYIMLSEISFKVEEQGGDRFYYPIIKKDRREEYYKAIGVCEITNPQYLFSDCNSSSNKKTFLIQ